MGQLTQFIQNKISRKKRKTIGEISKQEAIEQLDEKKQKLQALAKRLRRYKKSENRRKQNQTFSTNQKKFYQTLDNTEITINNPPNITVVEHFWSSIWSNPVQHNRHAQWIHAETDKYNMIQQIPDNLTSRSHPGNQFYTQLESSWKR